MKRRSSVEGRELRKTNRILKKLTSAEPSGLFGCLSIRRAEHGIGAGVAEAQWGLLLLRCPSRRRDESWRLHRSSLIFFVKNLTTAVSFFSSFRKFSLFLFHSLSTQASPFTRRCGESSLRACCKWGNASTSLDLSLRLEEKRDQRGRRKREEPLGVWKRRGASTWCLPPSIPGAPRLARRLLCWIIPSCLVVPLPHREGPTPFSPGPFFPSHAVRPF